MAAVLALALIKLALGIGAFALIGYIGHFHDKRIAGVLLTFPILNGIGILTGADPLAVADSIYAVVTLNGVLLFAMIACVRFVPPLPESMSAYGALASRVTMWTLIWAAGAASVVIWRDCLPGPGALAAIQCGLAAVVVALAWRPPRCKNDDGPAAPQSVGAHARQFADFWTHGAGPWRLAVFALCCVLLLAVAALIESRWIGMLSALPLPGLFALAMLATDEADQDFARIGDSVLFGPPLVVAFNVIYAHIIAFLPASTHRSLGFVALLVLLAADAALIFWIVPRISAYLDRVRAAHAVRGEGEA